MLSEHLDKLKSFVVIAQSGSIHEASKRLHITQPALSRLIKVLENACGTELFSRGRHGVRLTDAGEQLIIFANRTLKDLDSFEAKLLAPGNLRAGHITIGTYETLAEYLWPDFLLHMRKGNSDLAISLKTSSDIGHLDLLKRGEIDILVDAEPRISDDFVSWPLYKDRFNFFLKSKNAIELKPEDCKNLTLIYLPQAVDSDNRSILYHLEKNGYLFNKKIALDSFTTAQSFCSKGLGLAVLPKRLQARSPVGPMMEAVKLEGFSTRGFGEHTICATVSASKVKNPIISDFVKELKHWFKGENER